MHNGSCRVRQFGFVAAAATASVALALAAVAPAQAAPSASTPTITITLSPTTIDYVHDTITVSGTVSTVPAGTAVTVTYPDAVGYSSQVVSATSASGSYQATISGLGLEPPSETITATVAATATTSSASASASYGVAQDAVTVTASFAQPYVNADASDVLTGVVTVNSGGTSEPLADYLLDISTPGNAYSSSASATVKTGSDGSFTYTAPGSPGGTLSYTIFPSSLDLYGSLTVGFDINAAAQITSFTGTLSPGHVLQFNACGGTTAALPDEPLTGRLSYQYSAGPAGPWRTLGAGSEIQYGSCFVTAYGANYPGEFRAPLAAGYYRAYAPAVPFQMSAVSKTIYLRRYPARITGFSVTPARTDRDGKITVSGHLWRLAGKWLPDARQKVTIEYRRNGRTYVLRQQLTTSSSGRFSGTFRVPGTATWLAVYGGGSNQFATATRGVRVTVG
jgi:hypothetical protein